MGEVMCYRIELEKVKSRIQVTVVGRYQVFLLVTVYVTIVGGSLLSSLCNVLERPWNSLTILQDKLPQVACYFITYVTARAGLSAPMLLLFAALSAWEKPDEKTGRILIRPNYALEASNLVLVLVLGMTYCILAPAIVVACLVYFAMTALAYGWLFLYVYTPEYDCQGEMWHSMWFGVLFGLFFGAGALVSAASTFAGPGSFSFLASLILVMLIAGLIPFFWMTYSAPSKYLPLWVAREVDNASREQHTEGFFHLDYYFDPVILGTSQGLLSKDETSCFCCPSRANSALVSSSEDESSDSEDDDSPLCEKPGVCTGGIQESSSEEEESSADEASEMLRPGDRTDDGKKSHHSNVHVQKEGDVPLARVLTSL